MASTSQTDPSSTQNTDDNNPRIWFIPSILVPSTRLMIEEFAGKIVSIEGKTTSGNREKRQLPVQGTEVEKFTDNREGYKYDHTPEYGVLDQSRIRENGLNGPCGDELIDSLNEQLDPITNESGTTFPGDVPVQEMVLEFKSDIIQRQLSSETNQFRALYSSQRTEDAFYEITGELFEELALDKQQFPYRNLNLQSFAPLGSSQPEIKWTGKRDISPNPNNSLASLIHNHLHPQKYSRNKQYTVGEKNEAVIR